MRVSVRVSSRTCSTGAIACLALLAVHEQAVAQVSQSSPENLRRPITAPLRYAGVYHLGTGQWTRSSGAPRSLLGASDMIIYNNTCPASYYWGLVQNMA